MPARNRSSSKGLSPRVRGNHSLVGNMGNSERSIPACAGEPIKSALMIAMQGVYPRVCGGTMLPVSITSIVIGLSPRVRGNQPANPVGYERGGSIPACAGEPWLPPGLS